MEMRNWAQQPNERRVPDMQEMKVIIVNLLIVAFISIITPAVWLRFYQKAFVISHAVVYSSVYYHYSCDLSGFVKLIIFLSMCIVAIFELKSLIASISLMIVFAASYQGVRDFQFMFLIRAFLDVVISFFVSHEQNFASLGMHTAFYILWTISFLLFEPWKNGYEDLLLIVIIGGQVYALINKLSVEDGTVCIMAILSLAWAKLKSLHVRQIFLRVRMLPSFTEGLTALARARIIENLGQMFEIADWQLTTSSDESDENE